MSLIDPWLTPPMGFISPKVDFLKAPKDDNGQPYNPARLFALAEVLDKAGIDKGLLLKAYQDPLSVLNANSGHNLSASQAYLYSSMIFGTLFWDQFSGSMTRRDFLKTGGLAAGTILFLSACSPIVRPQSEGTNPGQSDTEEANVTEFDKCTAYLPSPSEPPLPIDRAVYDQKSIFQKAAFLISGGYVQEWTVAGRKEFFRQAANEAREVIVKSFSSFSSEDVTDLSDRVKIAGNRDEFISILTEKGFSSEKITSASENSLGVAFPADEDGKQRVVINLSLIDEFNSRNNNSDLAQAMMVLTNNLIHELDHLAVKPRETTEDEREKIKTAIAEFRQDDIKVVKIIDPDSELNIFYQLEGETNDQYHSLLSGGGEAFGTDWAETTREFSQQNFYRFLNSEAGSNIQMTADLSAYIGNRLLEYFHDKIGIPDEVIVNFINEFRKDRTKNFADLLNLYSSYAYRFNPRLKGSHVILTLVQIDAVSKVANNILSEANWEHLSEDDFVNQLCKLYDLYKTGQANLDTILEEARLDVYRKSREQEKVSHLPLIKSLMI